jgi:PAS domain S-box-containing protein
MTTKTTSEDLENAIKALVSSNAELTHKVQSLTEENLRYRSCFDRAIDSIFVLEDDHFIECNQTTLAMFDCDGVNDILGAHPWDFSPPHQPDGRPSKEKSIELIGAALSGNPQKFAWRHCKKNGQEFDTDVSLNLLETTGKKRVQAIVRETTELNCAREALRERDEGYLTLFDMVSDALGLIDIETGQMLDVNKAFIELYGYSKPEVLRMQNTDFSAEPEKTTEATQSRGVYVPIRWHKKKDGTVFPTEIAARIFRYEGRDVHMAAIREITERHRYEAQHRRSQKMQSLGLLAGGVAHDLNNVLSGLVSYPELLLLDLPEDSPLRNPIETIQESGKRATAIVEDLLTIARGVAITKEPLRLNDVVKDYLAAPEFKKLQLFHPNITVKSELDPNLMNISGSQVHIRKALMNLVSNAAEAIEGSGTVTISTSNRYIDKELNPYEKLEENDYVVLSVTDEGAGISSEELERIFEPFYTKKVMGRSGTGLGLAVVWNVVQDHDGAIEVASDKNRTTFELFFPITKDAILHVDSVLPISMYQGKGETILVVDDVEHQREITCKLLQRLGYKATAISSGEKAVEFLKHGSVDLVLLDMILEPGMNGRETYEKIIALHPAQKAILVSGFAETNEVKKAQQSGAGQFIKKPYTLEKIGLAIRNELSA